MSDSPQTCVTVEEELPLNVVAGSGDDLHNDSSPQTTSSTRRCPAFSSCCKDRHYRKLAICSIVCGVSCIGIKALISSVKAEVTKDPKEADVHLRQAKKWGIISVVTLVAILASLPILMALISYLLTLKD
ncbi:transmembrane protein 265-like [Notolabrus celidotus]|uniref:transmembrane protein 265-like n=1 Tax=Notolabrus celidotus TaxID=1203425 RepID=UPI00148FF598|nr:transmembrane protein 265-like [Notolabrus celidotus]